jgi:transposase
MRALQDAKTSLMLFGAKTESKDKVLAGKPGAGVGDDALQEPGAIAPSADKPATLRKGHGRNGASAYCDSPVLDIAVPLLKSGDPCPQCVAGKVYESPPRLLSK